MCICRLGHLQKLSDFNSSLTSSWFGWGYDLLVKKPVSWTYTSLVKQPLMWTWGKVIGEEVKSNNSSEDYVIPDLAQVIPLNPLCNTLCFNNVLTHDCAVGHTHTGTYAELYV